MREVMLAGSYWLHSIATVVWLGGITFILFIVMPSAKQVLGVEAGKLMGDISKRFTPIANYSIIFLIVTGVVLTAVNKQFSGIGNFGNIWFLSLIAVLFGTVLMCGRARSCNPAGGNPAPEGRPATG